MVIWFLKTLHSKPVIFLVYALKETDGENHKGKKPTKYSLPDSSIPDGTTEFTLVHKQHLKGTSILPLVRHSQGTLRSTL